MRADELSRLVSISLQRSAPRAMHALRVFRHVIVKPFEKELRVVHRFIRPGTAAIDVGANLGLYSHTFARSAEVVLSIEPNPLLARYLRTVLPSKCRVLEVALSNATGEQQTLIVPKDPLGYSQHALGALKVGEQRITTIDQTAAIHTVRCQTLDAARSGITETSLIKIDVEGHELAVLEGATHTIRHDHPVLLIEVEIRHNRRWRDVFQLLEEYGYRSFFLAKNRVCRLDYDSVPNLQYGSPLGTASARPDTYVNNFFFAHLRNSR